MQLLEFEPQKRLCSLAELQKHGYMADVNFEAVLSKKVTPPFVPSVSMHLWAMLNSYMSLKQQQKTR